MRHTPPTRRARLTRTTASRAPPWAPRPKPAQEYKMRRKCGQRREFGRRHACDRRIACDHPRPSSRCTPSSSRDRAICCGSKLRGACHSLACRDADPVSGLRFMDRTRTRPAQRLASPAEEPTWVMHRLLPFGKSERAAKQAHTNILQHGTQKHIAASGAGHRHHQPSGSPPKAGKSERRYRAGRGNEEERKGWAALRNQPSGGGRKSRRIGRQRRSSPFLRCSASHIQSGSTARTSVPGGSLRAHEDMDPPTGHATVTKRATLCCSTNVSGGSGTSSTAVSQMPVSCRCSTSS